MPFSQPLSLPVIYMRLRWTTDSNGKRTWACLELSVPSTALPPALQQNFPLIDSAILRARHLYLLQITISRKHSFSVQHLGKLLRMLRAAGVQYNSVCFIAVGQDRKDVRKVAVEARDHHQLVLHAQLPSSKVSSAIRADHSAFHGKESDDWRSLAHSISFGAFTFARPRADPARFDSAPLA